MKGIVIVHRTRNQFNILKASEIFFRLVLKRIGCTVPLGLPFYMSTLTKRRDRTSSMLPYFPESMILLFFCGQAVLPSIAMKIRDRTLYSLLNS